ncbi:MAG: hypothetical protein LBG58_12460 [Planctomycetaceae bacterium]|nr:hypothetical protein [Planctomycetaceae bacterium]
MSGDSLAQEIPFEFSQGWIPNPRATEEFSQSLYYSFLSRLLGCQGSAW